MEARPAGKTPRARNPYTGRYSPTLRGNPKKLRINRVGITFEQERKLQFSQWVTQTQEVFQEVNLASLP